MLLNLIPENLLVGIFRLLQRLKKVADFIKGDGDALPGGSTKRILIIDRIGLVIVFRTTSILSIAVVATRFRSETPALRGTGGGFGLLRVLFGRCYWDRCSS